MGIWFSNRRFHDSVSFSYLQKRHQSALIILSIFASPHAVSELIPISDYELSFSTARAELPGLALAEGLGLDLSAGGIELDLEVQSSIDRLEWQDEDGALEGEGGALILKGVHIGNSTTPITPEQVKNSSPFEASQLALINGLIIEADSKKGTLITLSELGDAEGNGVDIIVNDIYFGKDLSLEGQSGLGLLLEDVSNFVSDEYLNRLNQITGSDLASLDDGKNTVGGNFYPIKIAMQPIEAAQPAPELGLTSDVDEIIGIPGFGNTSMRLDAEFVIYMKKLAIYKEDWEAGVEGLLIYQGVDTNNDGLEDTVGPVVVNNLRMEAIQHQLLDGSEVQAMHFSNIDLNMDIAMENIYIGDSKAGSLGSIHIDDLHIKDTQMWIYPH